MSRFAAAGDFLNCGGGGTAANSIWETEMNGSHDTQEDHGSQEPPTSQGQEGWDAGHSGHGAASALATYKQRQERQQALDPHSSSGGHAL